MLDVTILNCLQGGQYDNLLRKMGKTSGAIGFAVYLDLLDELESKSADYDTDAILLYDDTTALADVMCAVSGLVADGVRVLAAKTVAKPILLFSRRKGTATFLRCIPIKVRPMSMPASALISSTATGSSKWA